VTELVAIFGAIVDMKEGGRWKLALRAGGCAMLCKWTEHMSAMLICNAMHAGQMIILSIAVCKSNVLYVSFLADSGSDTGYKAAR